ncbi:MAG: glycosyl transferase family 28 [Chitinophagaceae bacterium]|nr:glycosyl transferase family 28 [Chitinophagaceae bacterium]
MKGLKVLVSPLDWGLGHATRMIPLVHGFLEKGARVWLAASGPTAALLSSAFPQLTLLALEGYGIRYPRQGIFFLPSMFSQLPRVLNAISREKVWLEQMQRKFAWDLVVSDNRYGLYHPDARNILVTHQLYPKSGSILLPDYLVHRMHRHLMRRFDEIWIPDSPGQGNLSGVLSHPPYQGKPSHYIGPLSRLQPGVRPPVEGFETGRYLLVLLSGPEPQRSLLEEKILRSAVSFPKPVILVRGLPGSPGLPEIKDGVTLINHVDPSTLAALLTHAGWIVCRSGYSTIMDLVRLGKKALLVPTPGQPEQEYLAGYLGAMGYFPTLAQGAFTLDAALVACQEHRGAFPEFDFHAFEGFLQKRFPGPGVTDQFPIES